MDQNIYLAAPFFNEPQREVVTLLEAMIERHGHTCVSPRKGHASKAAATGTMTRERAEAILDQNVGDLRSCSMVFAVLDYHLPQGDHIGLLEAARPINPDQPEGIPNGYRLKRTISIPDQGVLWELGYAYACRKPVVLFQRDSNMHLNVMIGRTAWASIVGLDAAAEFLATLNTWTGSEV